MQVLRPTSIADALAILAGGNARLVAGGTALQLEWAKGLPKPRSLVDIGQIGGLKGIVPAGNGLRIGALTTLGAVERDATVREELPLLAAALRATAGPAVRNLATVGGNVAGRTGCLLPALLTLDARVESSCVAGRRTLPLSEWLRQEPGGEIIEAITVPVPDAHVRWTHRKIGLRIAFTPSVIGAAGIIEIVDGRVAAARLAVGGGVVTPARLGGAEALLVGQPFPGVDWNALRAAIEGEIVAPDDAFRSARYRRKVAANALVHGLGGGKTDAQPSRPSAPAARPATPPAGEIRLTRCTAGERWHIRPDGPAKIEGKLRYLTDHRQPGMLVGRILRAGIPHARILSIDTSAAEALPGVAAVVTHRDIAGSNAFGIVVQDQPALCFDKVRYVGDAVAAVAAVDAETAERALGLIRVRYAPLPVVSDPEQALSADAEPVHAAGNLQTSLGFERGDIAEGFARAAHVVEAVYETPRQMHGFMETEGGHAFVDTDGTLNVCAGGQYGLRDRQQLSRILGLPEEKIRVVTSPTGGAFGGKDELTVQPALALLALKTGQPVRLQLDRAESVLAGAKRNAMTIRMRTACDADGLLLAQQVDVISDAGAYASLGPAVLETALEHACGPYVVRNVRTSGRLAYTNNGVCGAFRGFGANQMAYAVECQMDRLAAECGLDVFEIRRRNMRKPGTRGYLGQVVAPSERLEEMLKAAAADPIWQRPRGPSDDGSEIVGTGMAMNYQGNGLGTLPPDPGGGALRLAADGAIEALYGLDEMGQGLLTSIRSAVAAALGCGRDDVRPVTGDTGRTPESGSTTASRGTFVVWKVAAKTAPALAERILARAAERLGREPATLAIAPGGIVERHSNSGELLLSFAALAEGLDPEKLPFAATSFEFPKSDYFEGNARMIFAFGVALARVAVSRITGQVRVLDLSQHTAAGPILDLAAYLGQIEGGGLQGVGFTLTEHAAMQDGRYVTANLDTYMMPSIADAPESVATYALENLDPGDPFGPRGAGELGIGAVTPAIANAVADATGVWPHAVPFDAERLLDALGAAA
ncbi:aldehyde oxidase [Mesorhizobium sp. M2A.F.Ca.ET.043.05.1.1]|uniref:molybdopterin cofactor-binding domain-containing protein n=1 Tax=Mesorhizobium sp. M2A.F.Ca.ET.043.05.1.1 TaxID=2493671 RepID=UPI000F75179F|nr:molybdopterin cofactor-binding domain-containing protein [Mesorhizobium sp. M2A.F.Ca.ET.043.05.1.1]AZO16436.1 aldehyde oxidase [Mesorhizobium sp. M2A.F.Ca.ET.043.05.1.1]